MFAVTFKVKDERLGETLRRLAELKVFDIEHKPMTNAREEGGKVVAIAPAGEENTTIAEQVFGALTRLHKKVVTRAEIGDVLEKLGRTATNAARGSTAAALKKAKLVKSAGRGKYRLNLAAVGKK